MLLSDVVAAISKVFAALLAVGGFTLFVAIILRIIQEIDERVGLSFFEAVGATFTFGVLAFVIGISMAAARDSAVANVVPVALTFIGGIAIFLVNRESKRALVVSCSVVSFSAMLMFGSIIGYYERYRGEQQYFRDTYNLDLLMFMSDIEFSVNGYRRALGLPPIDFQFKSEAKKD